jgi:hypothetical protein
MLPMCGFAGLIIMSISVPALVICAVHCELVVIRKRDWKKLSASLLAMIFTLGFIGIPLTIAAFQPIVGLVFFIGAGIMLEEVSRRVSSSQPRSSK